MLAAVEFAHHLDLVLDGFTMTLLGKLCNIRWVLDENPNLASSPFGIFDGRCIVDRKLEGNKEEKKKMEISA